MKVQPSSARTAVGASLPEVLIAVATSAIVFGGLMIGSIALQRSFSASERLANAQADLHRVADYMARDFRNATTINATATATVLLTVTMPDYYNRGGTPTNLADDLAHNPVLGRTGATYGANPVTIRYLKTGPRIFRAVTQVDGGASTTATTQIADNVETLTVTLDGEGAATINATSPVAYGRRKTEAQAPSIAFVMVSQPRKPTP